MRRWWLLRVISATLVGLLTSVFIYPDLMVSPGPLIRAHHEIDRNCFACHSPWRGVDSRRCVQCHTVAVIKTSFHQELAEQNCTVCHSDHKGRTLTNSNRKPFSHSLLRAAIRDQCQSCHQAPADRIHRDLTLNCSRCHTPEHWKPARFEHSQFFVLDGNHNARCSTCHMTEDYSRYTCYGCHEHWPDRIRAEHQEEGIRDFENCVDCHRSARGESEGTEQ